MQIFQVNESHLFGSRIHGQGRHPIFCLKYSDKVWQMKNIRSATLICKWRSNMPISPEVLRERENNVQNLTLTALWRAVVFLIFYSGLYGFLTNLKNKANNSFAMTKTWLLDIVSCILICSNSSKLCFTFSELA